MVNGKPQLTFGGISPAAAARQRNARAKTAESFASYLPLNDQNKALKPASAPASGRASTGSALAPANSRPFYGSLPPEYASGTQKQPSARSAVPGQPAGTQNLAQARSQVLGPQAMANTFGNSMAQNRISSKASPRISGTPITGRGNIGMVDTRKTVNRTSAPQNAATAAPAARGRASQGVVMPAGGDPFTGFSAYYGGFGSAPGQQSFISHGFSSKNAELALKKLGYDVRDARSIQTYARTLEPNPYALNKGTANEGGVIFGGTRPVNFPAGDDRARTAVLTASHRKKEQAAPVTTTTSLVPAFRKMADEGLGQLAAKFESGEEGIAAIGFDRKGGTSYGKYQIASRTGTMRAFIDYLHAKAPDIAKRLDAAGPANTGGRSGRMPTEWRRIAEQQPARFEELQSDFIRASHFEPAKQAIAASTGVAFESMPTALQEVLFSTAVQHGPAGATRIVSQALQRTGTDKLQHGKSSKKAEEQLITHIYNLRAGQFVSSTSGVQSAVRNRLKQEMREALQMLS